MSDFVYLCRNCGLKLYGSFTRCPACYSEDAYTQVLEFADLPDEERIYRLTILQERKKSLVSSSTPP